MHGEEPTADARTSMADNDEDTVVVAAEPSPIGVRALEPGDKVSRYVVISGLGKGGMGEVYVAHDPELDRRVALKVIRSQKLAELRRDDDDAGSLLGEAQAMARLAHPNVVNVFDAGLYGDALFIAMEYVEGVTLRRWLAERARGWHAILDVFVQAGRGLEAAHRCGIVHRDFKPANVMVDAEGRARVLDFGLAHETPSPDTAGSRDLESSVDWIRISQSDSNARVMFGTPGYMSPEQFMGRAVDARSDQFSFCVALFAALYGERPFAGSTLKEIQHEVMTGRVREVAVRGPKAIHRLLLRGLQASPEQRHPDMEALLRGLERARIQTVRRTIAACIVLGGVGLVALGYAGATSGIGNEQGVCAGAEARLEGAWDDARRDAMRETFAAIDKPYASATWRAVESSLDDYVRRWAAVYVDACEATHVRGDQSDELLDLRMRCLDQRRSALAATVGTLVDADEAIAQKAYEIASKLPDLWACSDAESLSAPVALPADPAVVERVERLRAKLAEAETALSAVRHDEALTQVDDILAVAEGLGYAPVLAEARMLKAEIFALKGDYVRAEEHHLAAIWAGTASRHDLVVARSWVELTRGAAMRAEHDAAERYARHAEAMLSRMPENRVLQYGLEQAVGALRFTQDRYEDAIEAFERALDIAEAMRQPQRIFLALSNVGAAQGSMARHEEARVTFERALALAHETLGEHHPYAAVCINNIGNTYERLGAPEAAAAAYRRALRIRLAALGPDHPDLAQSYSNLGSQLTRLGEHAEALEMLEKALAIRQQTLSLEHPSTALTINNLGGALTAVGRADEAIPMLLDTRERIIAKFGPDYRTVAYLTGTLGHALAAARRFEEGVAEFERAIALGTELGLDPLDVAEEEVRLVAALVASGAPRSRVETVAASARARLEPLGEPGQAKLERLADLLAGAGGNHPMAR